MTLWTALKYAILPAFSISIVFLFRCFFSSLDFCRHSCLVTSRRCFFASRFCAFFDSFSAAHSALSTLSALSVGVPTDCSAGSFGVAFDSASVTNSLIDCAPLPIPPTGLCPRRAGCVSHFSNLSTEHPSCLLSGPINKTNPNWSHDCFSQREQKIKFCLHSARWFTTDRCGD